MTASNLGICIGCSILYPKEQPLSNSSISNSYASGSTILELMIIHYKQLFPDGSHQEQTSKTLKSQPDLIPIEFYSVQSNFLCHVKKMNSSLPFACRKVAAVQMKIY